MLCKSPDRKSLNSPLGCVQLTYIKSIDIYAKQKHTRGKKSKAKSEALVNSYSCIRLKSMISGGGQGPSLSLATM